MYHYGTEFCIKWTTLCNCWCMVLKLPHSKTVPMVYFIVGLYSSFFSELEH
jgi:hypothetical protein